MKVPPAVLWRVWWPALPLICHIQGGTFPLQKVYVPLHNRIPFFLSKFGIGPGATPWGVKRFWRKVEKSFVTKCFVYRVFSFDKLCHMYHHMVSCWPYNLCSDRSNNYFYLKAVPYSVEQPHTNQISWYCKNTVTLWPSGVTKIFLFCSRLRFTLTLYFAMFSWCQLNFPVLQPPEI